MKRSVLGAAAVLAVAAAGSEAQERGGVVVFHSNQTANLPTATTLREGDWLFEISHRFQPPFAEGPDALWGLDGPVLYRLGLSYSATDRIMLAVQRTNLADNVELSAKVRLYSGGSAGMPFMVAVGGGAAWNTDPAIVEGAEDNELQAYGLLMVNALFAERVALGIVPGVVHNPRILDTETESLFVIGVQSQLYLTDAMSLLGEWIATEERPDLEFDGATFGVEFETRGHFFKLLATNQLRPNLTQVLGGSSVEFVPDEWRFGFNITRLLPF